MGKQRGGGKGVRRRKREAWKGREIEGERRRERE